MNQVKEEEKGIKLDATPAQVVVIAVMFIIFFVAPAMIFSPKEEQVYTESYTQVALTESTEGTASVAGASTSADIERDSGYFQFPGTDYQFSSDLSNPATVAIIVGTIFGIVSMILFLSMFFDFFKG